MFTKLTDLSYKRDFFEAFGFYIASVVLITVISIIGAVITPMLGMTGEQGILVMVSINAFLCPAIGAAIICKRKLNWLLYVPILILAGYLAFIGKEIAGLIGIAALTYVPADWPNKKHQETEETNDESNV